MCTNVSFICVCALQSFGNIVQGAGRRGSPRAEYQWVSTRETSKTIRRGILKIEQVHIVMIYHVVPHYRVSFWRRKKLQRWLQPALPRAFPMTSAAATKTRAIVLLGTLGAFVMTRGSRALPLWTLLLVGLQPLLHPSVHWH